MSVKQNVGNVMVGLIRFLVFGLLCSVSLGCSSDAGPKSDVAGASDAAVTDLMTDLGAPTPDVAKADVAQSDLSTADGAIPPEDAGSPRPNLEGLCVNSAPNPGSPLAIFNAAPKTEVKNPISGVMLPVYVIAPSSGEGPWPVVVLVSGGMGGAENMSKSAPGLVNAGVVTVLFDPDGRGTAQGEEDQCGLVHQAGLGAVIRLAADLPCADTDRVGVFTTSFGITMGAGALANDPSLPAKFLIDWEGPANRDDTGGCDADGTGHMADWSYEKDGETIALTCDDEFYWEHREASTSIGQIQVPYYRLQADEDHAQPDHKHTILMVNNALAGSPPQVFLNHQEVTEPLPNQFPNIPPALRAENPIGDTQVIVDWIKALPLQ